MGKMVYLKRSQIIWIYPRQPRGKNIHTYIDYPVTGELTDYNGVTARYDEKTGVHLEPTGYSLSLSVMYINYLRGIKFKD